MEVLDVIELGSSDEEPAQPPRKKMKTVENAMVHIPTKIHGVTIKPVKASSTNAQKLFSGQSVTVTKLPKPIAPAQANKPKQTRPDKPVQKNLAKVVKKKVTPKCNIVKSRGSVVINPLNQVKKMASQSFANSNVVKLKNPIQISNISSMPALDKLPPSVTIKKTGTAIMPRGSIVPVPKIVPKRINTIKKKKNPVVQTVELDDEESPSSSDRPQWYMRPEEQTKNGVASNQETINNKEPENPTYIEITIEDSPIKPPKTKRTRELSIENIVTIEDSPNKDGAVTADPDEVSDDESKTSKKVPHSKKKLEYEHDLPIIEETHTFEIEIDPIAVDESISVIEKDNQTLSLPPDIVEVEESTVEIARNQQGGVSIVQTKPLQTKEKAGPSTVTNELDENEFHPTYLSFINLCLQLENSDDMKKIVEKKIKTYYRQVPKEYTQSEEFIDMVSGKVSSIKAAPEKMYLYIKDIVDELNLQRKLAKQMPTVEDKPKEEESFSLGKDGDFEPNKQRQIRKLEKTLKKLNRAIQKLETQEVDFDDDEDSVYLLTEKYKERMVRVHAKFCQLTNSKMPSEPRLVIDPRPGQAPGPAKRLEAWINKKDTLVFPDFHDVLCCVRKANSEDNLGWTETCIMEEARDLFVRCGRKLQRRRQEKEWRIATSRVTQMEDPADQSSELKKRLEDNRRLANTKESEVFDKFSDKQNQLKLEAVEISDKEAEESPIESDEEENVESLSLESKQRRKERLKRLLQEQSKKNFPKKVKDMETISNEEKEKESDVQCNDNKAEAPTKQTVHDDDSSIQSLSDDSNEIGSDVDELHLLQKLHSDNEIRSDSTSESSDSDTPIAISDTLDSSSDEGRKGKEEKPCDIISIENSSYSDESDSKLSNEKINKKQNVTNKEIVKQSKDTECASETVAKTLFFTDDLLEDALLASSDTESNASGLLLSEHNKSGSDNKSSEECLNEKSQNTPENDLSIISKTAEIRCNTNKFEIPKHSEKVEGDNECMNTNIYNTDKLLETSVKNKSDPLNKSSSKNLETDSNVHDNLDTRSTKDSEPSTNALLSDSDNKLTSKECKNVEEPPMNSISPTFTPEELDSGLSLTQSNVSSSIEDACMSSKDVSLLMSEPMSFDSDEILASSSIKSLENEVATGTFVVDETNTPMEGILEGTEELGSGDVCAESEIGSDILISNVVSTRKTDETIKENLNPNKDLYDLHDDSGSHNMSNGNSNSDVNTPDLFQSITDSSTKNDTTDTNNQEDTVVRENPIPEQALDSVEKILEDVFDSQLQ